MENQNKREDMNIVIVGHVDHGKSTLMGRLLADTGSLPEGKLEQVKETCRRNAKPFEYAFLLDALKDEQSQGITIDAARCFFKTEKRDYIILDAPGHIEFLKNMITGAARAQAALLLIDAKEGVQENSRRHGYMLSMLGIKQIAVVINKMDLVDYSEEVYEKVKNEYLEFLKQINVEPKFVLPVSSFEGENVVKQSEKMPWYKGKDILQTLDSFDCEVEDNKAVFRMPVQDVYKFTEGGDDRRIVAGTIDSGVIKVGDEVRFYPSGKKSHINSIERFNAPTITEAGVDMAVGFTLKEQIYIRRGEYMAIVGQQEPKVATRIGVNIFWLGKRHFTKDKSYFIKIGAQKVKAELEQIVGIINSSSMDAIVNDDVGTNEVAECILRTDKPISFDLVEDNAKSSRFVIVDNYEIVGGGIITKSLEDEQSVVRDKVLLRNLKWEYSEITKEQRAERYCQKPRFILFTGDKGAGKKNIAKSFEKELLNMGRFVYYLGIGTFLYGVDSDLKMAEGTVQEEHIRRFSEVVNLMLDSGMIVVATATNVRQCDLETMKTVIGDDIDVVWIGEKVTTDIDIDIKVRDAMDFENISLIKQNLKDKGTIFNG